MLSWAADYWYLCLAALLIGVATAAWIWLGGRVEPDVHPDIDEPSGKAAKAPAPAPLEPVKPVIEVAQPVKFDAPEPAVVAATVDSDGAKPKIAPATGDPDNLSLIKGVGPKLKAVLTTLGVTRFDQIAAWTDADIAEVDQYLGTFKGRITRDNWVEQASYLAKGDHEGFAARFGAVGG